jgi:cytolysin-activating lysine-acyltransferase
LFDTDTFAVRPRYRHGSVADLQHLVLEPLMRDRIAIAPPSGSDGANAPDGGFPVRLKPEDWTSGDNIWLLDVVAPSQKMASSILANFKQVVKKGGDIRIHPIVARQVDPELLKKMGASADVSKSS